MRLGNCARRCPHASRASSRRARQTIPRLGCLRPGFNPLAEHVHETVSPQFNSFGTELFASVFQHVASMTVKGFETFLVQKRRVSSSRRPKVGLAVSHCSRTTLAIVASRCYSRAFFPPYAANRLQDSNAKVKHVIKKAKFEGDAFYAALDGKRQARQCTWKRVAKESGISASSLTRNSQGKRPDVESLRMLSFRSGLDAHKSSREVHPRRSQSL